MPLSILDITFIKKAESDILQSSKSFIFQVVFQSIFLKNSLAPQKVKLKLHMYREADRCKTNH